MADEFASLVWSPDDVQTLGPVNKETGEPMTDEQAREFLQKTQNRIRDRLCELGWDVIGDMLLAEGWKTGGE